MQYGKWVLVVAAFLMGGCATSSIVSPTMDNSDYLKATPEQQAAYQEAIKGEQKALAAKLQAELEAGRPVLYGDGATRFTLQKVVLPGDRDLLAYYPGHNPEGLDGRNSEGMVVLVTDKQGKVLYKGDNPVTLLANVATNNDTGRDILTGLFPAIFNGVGSAIVNKAVNCDGCNGNGVTVVNQGGLAVAGAISASDAHSNAVVKGSGMPMK